MGLNSLSSAFILAANLASSEPTAPQHGISTYEDMANPVDESENDQPNEETVAIDRVAVLPSGNKKLNGLKNDTKNKENNNGWQKLKPTDNPLPKALQSQVIASRNRFNINRRPTMRSSKNGSR